jgi:hypothetical protein
VPIDGSAYIEETIDPDPLGDGSAEDVRLKIRLDTLGNGSFVRLQECR